MWASYIAGDEKFRPENEAPMKGIISSEENLVASAQENGSSAEGTSVSIVEDEERITRPPILMALAEEVIPSPLFPSSLYIKGC